MAASFLFEDHFELREMDMEVDPKDLSKKVRDKKFDNVSRIFATSENSDTELTLDVHTMVYPMTEGEKFQLVLTSNLDERGLEDPVLVYSDQDPPSLKDHYEYVMYGIVFKYVEERGKAVVYASFGGLLMELRGEGRALRPQLFEVDSRLYLLIKKT
mmetsp:Transcript_11768/g.23967  ORF Transcript_11768/g.23967 Transcript_11768/m.23967 type:complete len:157 (-) Transcript_11768:137-607(-)